MNKQKKEKKLKKGWKCERCGAIYAEYVNGCPRCATGEVGGSASVFPTDDNQNRF